MLALQASCVLVYIRFVGSARVDIDQAVPIGPDYPYYDTAAKLMLKSGIDFQKRQGTSLRTLAKNLGYRQATVLSHMANGRVGIPIERAVEIADAVGIDPASFLVAVVAQKAPEASMLLDANGGTRHSLANELSTIAGAGLDQLTEDKKHILREVAEAQDPGRRWLSTAELAAVALIRNLRPEFKSRGLSSSDMIRIDAALRQGN